MNVSEFMKTYANEHKLLNQAIAQKLDAFLQHVLLLSSTLLGVLVSLALGKSTDPLTRYSLVVAMSLLALGILSGACSLYAHVHILRRLRQAHHNEYQTATLFHREPQMVSVKPHKFFVIAEFVCYISLGLSIVALASYAIFVTLA